jgi:hypothetical protein
MCARVEEIPRCARNDPHATVIPNHSAVTLSKAKSLRTSFLKSALTTLALTFLFAGGEFVRANPYLARPGEPMVKARVATCAVTGGFIHF